MVYETSISQDRIYQLIQYIQRGIDGSLYITKGHLMRFDYKSGSRRLSLFDLIYLQNLLAAAQRGEFQLSYENFYAILNYV